MIRSLALLISLGLLASACATKLPEIKHPVYTFPKDVVFIEDTPRPYSVLGQVRARVDFPSLDYNREIEDLCKNYFNKGVRQLLSLTRDKGGDAVIGVRSIVFLEDGRREEFPRPECADDGAEGQVLLQGIAVRWKRDPADELASPTPSGSPEPRMRIQPIRRRVRQDEFLPTGDPRSHDDKRTIDFPSRAGRGE